MPELGKLEETFVLHGVAVRVFAREDPVHGGVIRTYEGIEEALATPEARAERARAVRKAQAETSPVFVSGSMLTA